MSATPMTNLSRCAIHTMTNKPWSLAQCCEAYAAAGVGGVGVWRNTVAPQEGGVGVEEAVRIVRGAGLAVPAYVRGGFFPAEDLAKRQAAVDHNKQMLDEAAALGAEQLVLVVGAIPGVAADQARMQVVEGIAACIGHAEQVGVKLSIEPLHPMYAADKSCVNRMSDARQICELIGHPMLGIAVDVYHVWWDSELEWEISVAGEQGTLFGFHVCDWRVDTRHMLTDRGLMGEGCINIPTIRGWVEAAGFDGFNEVEVFSEENWATDQRAYLDKITEAYLAHV